jgi:dTMP kinase
MTKYPVLIMLRIEIFVQTRLMDSKKKKRNKPSTPDANPPVLSNFVVLEGLDGSGTTTQLELAERRLTRLGVPHHCTCEPTDGPVGTTIRSILKRRLKAQPSTVALLFAADRTEHLWHEPEGIVHHLDRGELVVCDRYLFSSLAYQSLACEFEFVYSLNSGFPLPEHLVFVDTPVILSQSRIAAREANELYDVADIQGSIQSGYERSFSMFRNTGMQLHRINGSDQADTVFDKFWSILESLPIVKG